MEFRPAVVYGAACLGSPPELVERARLATSAALSGQPAGEDRAVRLLLISADPAKTFTPRPIIKWAKGVWSHVGKTCRARPGEQASARRGPMGRCSGRLCEGRLKQCS